MDNEQKPKPGFLGHKLEGATDKVPPAAWEKIEAKLERKRRRKVIFWWFFPVGLLLIGLAVVWSYQPWKAPKNIELIAQEKDKPEHDSTEKQQQLSKSRQTNLADQSKAGEHGNETKQEQQALPEKSTPEASQVASGGSSESNQLAKHKLRNKVRENSEKRSVAVLEPKQNSMNMQDTENQQHQRSNSNVKADQGNSSDLAIDPNRSFKNDKAGEKQQEKVQKPIAKSNRRKSFPPAAMIDPNRNPKEGRSWNNREEINSEIVLNESPKQDNPEAKSETDTAKQPQIVKATINTLYLKISGVQGLPYLPKTPDWKLTDSLPGPLVATQDTSVEKKKGKKERPFLNIIALQGGLSQQQVTLRSLPDLEPAFRPQLVLQADKLRTIRWGRFEFSKLLKLSPTIMTGLGVQGSLYSQKINATLNASTFTPVTFAGTADSLIFLGTPDFKPKTTDFKRLGLEAGVHANIFWQPLWSPVGLKAQATLVSASTNWTQQLNSLLPNYSLGIFYTTKQRVYMNMEWQWWAPARKMLPVNMNTQGKMSGINVGIGYYWK